MCRRQAGVAESASKLEGGLCAKSRPVQMGALDVSETAEYQPQACLCHRCRRPMAFCTTSRDEEPAAEYFLSCP